MPLHFRNHALIGVLVAAAVSIALPIGPVWAQDDTCRYSFDGQCDHPGTGTGACPPATDQSDCDNPIYSEPVPGEQFCRYHNDGKCDQPGVGTGWCRAGTDHVDCQGIGNDDCEFARNGKCDEPRGSGFCRMGTDTADCRP